MQRGVYTEVETEKILKKYIPVAKHVLVQTFREAVEASRKIRFPLVLKIMSKDALHKSEIKGVRLIKNKVDFEHEYKDLVSIVKKKKISFDGIMVQEYVKGESVILGLKKDPTFGHVLAFGVGGVYTELLKDVSFRVCPLTHKDAQEMIDELKMKELLYGFRGAERVNTRFLKEVMIKLSKLPSKYPDVSELDINPFVINSRSGKVVDARMVI
jgi:succinyl-CoA synthetase beta subunit